jgi:carbohydrate-binding DOMON domain-containing protein
VAGSGRRDLYAGRQARTTAANAWEFFVRASMDSVALYDSRAGRLDGVKVTSYADPAAKSILVRVPLEAVGGAGEDWNVIVALLGHDGYAPGGVRPVKADTGQWVFGGCEHEQLCPRIIDLVVEGGASQEQILSSFRAGGLPAEIPGIRMTLR